MSNGNSRYLKIGPGGRRCNYCFPAPGSKDRRAQFRSAKRKADRDAMRQAQNDLIDHQELLYELQTMLQEFDDDHFDDDHFDDDWNFQLHKSDLIYDDYFDDWAA
jgi:hypothetical protein